MTLFNNFLISITPHVIDLQTLERNTESLVEEVTSHPDVNLLLHPKRALLENDFYLFEYPQSAKYRIGLIVDPCRFNAYNCCINVFGSPEYPALLRSNLEQDRAFKYQVIADDEETSKNYFLVTEDGGSMKEAARRSADDYELIDYSCVSVGNPHRYCQGRNYALKRSPLRPNCVDNNQTVDALAGCYAANGTKLEKCVAVAFGSSTFIPQCGVNEDGNCGTYLEIHMAHGTPYQSESTVIAESQIDQRNVSGFYTMTLPLTWMKNQTKVLCSYSESVFRVGSLVYIKSSSPVCCCPPPFQAATRVGSFQCPIGPTSNGAFGKRPKTLADTLVVDTLMLDYPFCPIDLSYSEDRMMCSVYDIKDRRAYTRECLAVEKIDKSRDRSWTSIDLDSQYDGMCPYYPSCGLTLDMGKCRLDDLRFTFIGQVGIVTAVDFLQVIPQVWVSFNDGRTSYQFSQLDVELETRSKSMYEIWWVVRSKSWKTVQKRKQFNITYPACTFDTTNNR